MGAEGAVCDDCLAAAAGFTQRQTAYQVASQLAATGRIQRNRAACSICGRVKNASWVGQLPPVPVPVQSTPLDGEERLWHWEGNVQNRIAAALRQRGISITAFANTATKEQGIDIVAQTPEGRTLLVTVKGYPVLTIGRAIPKPVTSLQTPC